MVYLFDKVFALLSKQDSVGLLSAIGLFYNIYIIETFEACIQYSQKEKV